MSVLIKGIKKPKRCMSFDGQCPFLNDEDNCVLQEPIDGTWDDLYANCPLVELPKKHGRLIDANEIYFSMTNSTDQDIAEEAIRETPTVIEAEGEE